ncbi:MAG: SIP domain-containing protein [Pseudomonadales bacterium]|nr:SIP domain-containing protein [Pseudomonadales bacterium]MBO6595298.1 SIP domain-containing protein [Pseudomonadales bacterium]MBO6821143.1 SIP domain-containing protein [Pseudomonadales bacterium]
MSWSDALSASINEILEHYNDQHPDTVTFIARYYLGHKNALKAEITEVTKDSMSLAIQTIDGSWSHGLKLSVPIEKRDHFPENFIGLVMQARSKAGEDVPRTTIEEEIARNATLKTYSATVKKMQWITNNIREITVEVGSEFSSPGWDAFMFVMVPHQGETLPPEYDIATWRNVAVEERSGGAYYTIREKRGTELDLWFVIHETYGAVSHWAANASENDRIALWGPRTGFNPPEGTNSYLLLGDETAYPAIAAIVDALPSDARVHAILETHSEQIALRQEKGWRITWAQRQGEEGADYALARTIGGLEIDLKADGLYIFGAAEARQIAGIRSSLKRQGIQRENMHLTGYWRKA